MRDILKLSRVPVISELLRNAELRKIKIHMWNVSVLSCYGPSFHHQRHEKERVQVPQQNEMVSLDCATLGFISKNEVYKLENNI